MSGKRKTRAELLSEVINRNVVTVSPTAALSEAAYLMMNEDIGALVVVDGALGGRGGRQVFQFRQAQSAR